MTVMYSFCLTFPVRLGAVIVGVSAGVQSLACLVACIVGISDLDKTSRDIEDWLNHNNLLLTTAFFLCMRNDPHSYLTGLIVIFCIHIFTCVLLVCGAYFCSISLIYPFVGLDAVRMVLLSFLLVVVILIVKTNTLTLGYVIACSIIGGFLLLYLWYQWFCVISLCQILRHVENLEEFSQPPTKPDFSGNPSKSEFSYAPFTLGRQQDVSLYSKKPQYFGLPRITY